MTFWSSHPFPCQGSEKTWALTEEQIHQWSELYPGVDVDLTLRQALAWVLADTRRAKTAKGMTRFCVNWLNNSVNRGTAVKRVEMKPDIRGHYPPCRTNTECLQKVLAS